jgi:1-acyl-sn-glycerol-3-phosphate acyltransferase
MNDMITTHASASEAVPGNSDQSSGQPVRRNASWQLGPNVPQSQRHWLRALGLWILTRIGWRFDGAMPDLPKFVVIVAPHTSNWDFIIGLAAKWALGLDAHFWGKDTLFLPPLGWFMKANGGIAIDRSNSAKVVDTTVAAIQASERFVLALAPEGTRKRVTQWRSGFWHVAHSAQIPICCVAFDYPSKTVRMGPTTMATEADPEAGITRIRTYYHGVQGKY